jgi:uncharacterized LabA/DUF88 family protein
VTVVVLVDWENIFYTLDRDYHTEVRAMQCLKAIVSKASRYGNVQRVTVFYGEHLQQEDEGLVSAIQFCRAVPYPLATKTRRGKPERNLVDTYMAVEAIVLFFQLKPETTVIVAGDKGYTPVLQAIRDRQGKAVVFGLKRSTAQLLQESEFIRDEIEFLDDVLLGPAQRPLQPISAMAGLQETESAEVLKERTSVDVQRLLMTMMEYLPQMPYRHISVGRLGELLGLTDEDTEEWDNWKVLIAHAVENGQLNVADVPMPNGTQKPHYEPNWLDPLVLETILDWVVLVGTITRETTKAGEPVPLVRVLDRLAPFAVDPQTGRRIRAANPERDRLKNLYTIGVERDAIRASTAIKPSTEITEEARPVTVAMVTLHAQHPLIKEPVQVQVQLSNLPERMQEDVSSLIDAVRDCCEKRGEEEISASTLFIRLPRGFPRKVLLVAEFLKLVQIRMTASPEGRLTTLVKVAT